MTRDSEINRIYRTTVERMRANKSRPFQKDARPQHRRQNMTTDLEQIQPEQLTMDAIRAEVTRARLKFPSNRHLLAALMEETGELAQAFLQGKPWDEIEKEAIQVACVAIRILEEGDSDYPETVRNRTWSK